MAVVVVLPWVPATAMPVRSCIRRPRKSERLRTGMPAAWAADYFGVVIGDGRGAHHQIGAGDIVGGVTGEDGGPGGSSARVRRWRPGQNR